MQSKATTQWEGDLMSGKGSTAGSSGTFQADLNWKARTEGAAKHTTPEELLAAAHASCFSMALSAELEKVGLTPENIDSKATVSLDKVETGFAVTTSHLEVTVKLTNPDKSKFERAAEAAKVGCPISKLIAAAKITLDAKLA